MPAGSSASRSDPLWYKDAIIYEVPVKAFRDSDGDGTGDFAGMLEKLDYLESLGVTALWLLPFYPSPRRDDGYDIADYYGIHPEYGTIRDFRRFLKEAHRRGIRVITELVVNHTSNEHPWFQRARRAPAGSAYRKFYVWSDTPDRYRDARIIFQDYETSNWSWDATAGAYYWHRFYSGQPDLNFDNQRVEREIFRVMEHWLDMGVDGLRLDAVPYLYEREDTNCENLPETHAFLRRLRAHVDRRYGDRLLLAEANQWPEDAVAYFGQGDECHMCYHFPVMPRLFMALNLEDRFPVMDILDQTPAIPEVAQWAMFLRNHDELTLEMVTDEERDYMYRAYARDPRSRLNLGIRRRLAPLLYNDRRKIELMNALLFSLPGTPVLYYGDEIGMGDNYYLGDRDGVRTPMQWSPDRNAGFSSANPQRLYLPVIIDPEYHYEALNVENQERNLSSLLWFMKRLIAQRKRFRSLSRGTLEVLLPDNPKVLAFLREYEGEQLLLVFNLSRFNEVAEMDLSRFAGAVPEEAVSHNQFPLVLEAPYRLTLGPYAHLWLELKHEEAPLLVGAREGVPELAVRRSWTAVLNGEVRARVEKEVLPAYLARMRWFGGKSRTLRRVRIQDQVELANRSSGRQGEKARQPAGPQLLVVEVEYAGDMREHYLLPLSWLAEADGQRLAEEQPQAVIALLILDEHAGYLVDGIYDPECRAALLGLAVQRKHLRGLCGEVYAERGRELRSLAEAQDGSRVLKAEQSNSSLLYGETIYAKLYRRVEEGINPEPEVVRFLSEHARFAHVPQFAGRLAYRTDGAERSIMLFQQFVPSQGDGWTITLNSVGQYFEQGLARRNEFQESGLEAPSPLTVDEPELPEILQELIGGHYLEQATLIGRRTAQMHLALSHPGEDRAFVPEPFSKLYLRALYQSLRNRTVRALQQLETAARRLPEGSAQEAMRVVAARPAILTFFKRVTEGQVSGMKIRIHGDYHLGQLLYTGRDFVVIDFEGEPLVDPSERRLKYSPLRDVAGMIRSFHYAVHSVLFSYSEDRPEDASLLESLAEPWFSAVSSVFLNAYRQTVQEAVAAGRWSFLPQEADTFRELLVAFLLNKAIYEVGYELDNRPGWVAIPLRGVAAILEEIDGGDGA